MIPYDDLVVALAAWRARQGLPGTQLVGGLTPPAAAARSVHRATPASGSAPIGAPRTAPPGAPPGRGFVGGVATPPPLAAAPDTTDDSLDVDDAALLEEASYDPHAYPRGESTAIGVPPPPRTADGGRDAGPDDLPPPPRGGRRTQNW